MNVVDGAGVLCAQCELFHLVKAVQLQMGCTGKGHGWLPEANTKAHSRGVGAWRGLWSDGSFRRTPGS